MRYARSKNLTVYDVVIIASLIDREVSVASERKLVAVGDLQPSEGRGSRWASTRQRASRPATGPSR